MPIIDTFTTAFDFKADFAGLKRIQGEVLKTSDTLNKLSGPLIGIGTAFSGFVAGATIAFASAETKTQEYVGLIGLTQKEADKLTAASGRMAREYGAAMGEIQQAGFTLASSGQRGTTLMESLEVVAKGAAAGLGDVADVGNAVAKSMNNWAADGLKAQEVVDGIVETAKVGLVSASDLAMVYADVGSTMNTMGVSFQETSGLLARMSLGTASASVAGTQLTAVTRSLLKPADELKRILDNAGLGVDELKQKIGDQGLLSVLLELQQQTGLTNASFAKLFGRAEAISGVGILLADLEDTKEKVEALKDSTGETTLAFEAVADTLKTIFNQSKQSVEGLLKVFGEPMVAVLKPIVGFFTDMTNRLIEFLNNHPLLKNMVVTFIGLGAALLPVGLALKGIAVALGLVGKAAIAASIKMAGITLGLSVAIPLAIELWQHFRGEPEEAAEEVDYVTEAMKGLGDETVNTKKELLDLAHVRLVDMSIGVSNVHQKVLELDEQIKASRAKSNTYFAYGYGANAVRVDSKETKKLIQQRNEAQKQLEGMADGLTAVNMKYTALSTAMRENSTVTGESKDEIDKLVTGTQLYQDKIAELRNKLALLKDTPIELHRQLYQAEKELELYTQDMQSRLDNEWALELSIKTDNLDVLGLGDQELIPFESEIVDISGAVTGRTEDQVFRPAEEAFERFAMRVERIMGELMYSLSGVILGDTSVADAFRDLGRQAIIAFMEEVNTRIVAGIIHRAFGQGISGGTGGGGGSFFSKLLGLGGSAQQVAGLAGGGGGSALGGVGTGGGTALLGGSGGTAALGGVGTGLLAATGGIAALGLTMGAMFSHLAKNRKKTDMYNQRMIDSGLRGDYRTGKAKWHGPVLPGQVDDMLASIVDPGSERFKQLGQVSGPASVQPGPVNRTTNITIGEGAIKIEGGEGNAREVAEQVYKTLRDSEWQDAGELFYSDMRL